MKAMESHSPVACSGSAVSVNPSFSVIAASVQGVPLGLQYLDFSDDLLGLGETLLVVASRLIDHAGKRGQPPALGLNLAPHLVQQPYPVVDLSLQLQPARDVSHRSTPH